MHSSAVQALSPLFVLGPLGLFLLAVAAVGMLLAAGYQYGRTR